MAIKFKENRETVRYVMFEDLKEEDTGIVQQGSWEGRPFQFVNGAVWDMLDLEEMSEEIAEESKFEICDLVIGRA